MTYRKALDKMDRILEQNLLYDFYGELLTEHQQRVYEDAVYNDMSLGEIAGEQGISRQGVHDLILSLIHISEPTRLLRRSRMPSSA